MPKVFSSKLHTLAKEFSEDAIVTNGNILHCDICNITITVDEKHLASRVGQHVRTLKHQQNKALKTRKEPGTSSRQQPLNNSLQNTATGNTRMNEYFFDLAAAFIQSGIPLGKINHPSLRQFLEKYMKTTIPRESTLRKNYVEPIYAKTVEKILLVIADHPVCFIVNETTDTMKRYILNILIVPLTGKPEIPMLFKMYNLPRVNSSNVMQAFNDACAKLWPTGIKYDRVWLLLSDQATYMLDAGNGLKMLYPQLKHVTCIAHALHRVCEAVRIEFSILNSFISEMKKVLAKHPSHIQLYKEVTSLPLPPEPVLTRWGTWITAAVFYCENFCKITEFINALDESSSEAVKKVKLLLMDVKLGTELFATREYKFIINSINKLEERGLSIETQWDVVKNAKEQLDGFAREKLEMSLQTNPDINCFGDGIQTCDLEFQVKTKFAPLVTIDVERSFPEYKYFLSPSKQKLKFSNIEMVNVVKYNSFLFYDKCDVESDDGSE